MDDAIQFIETFRCSQCGAPLEVRTPAAPWVRCPRCGRASRAPEQGRIEPGRRAASPPSEPGGDVLVIGPEPEPRPMTPVAHGALMTIAGPEPLRVLASVTLFVSVALLVFAFLDGGVLGTSVFSSIALVCVVLLLIPPRPAG